MFKALKERIRFFYGVSRRAEAIYAMQARQYRDMVLAPERASEPRKITAYGYTAYSMNDDDGIIQEVFRRIGLTNRRFVEFGAGDGVESNTVYLLLTGWNGLWLDAGDEELATIYANFSDHMKAGRLKTQKAFITRENINDLIGAHINGEIDLLSVDIDGNDYWVWESLTVIQPRVVVIEYNATFRPPHKIVQEYQPGYVWNSTNYFGASLKALEDLGRRKGYSLVGCNFAGINAFFVRHDLTGDHFAPPFTAEEHYREPIYDAFVRGYSRHRRGVGKYVLLP